MIFVIDSNDRERVGEARDELQRMLAEDELRDAVLLIFANKQVRFRLLMISQTLRDTSKLCLIDHVIFLFISLGFTECYECRRNHR